MSRNDVLKRYLDAGMELSAVTQARAETLVKDLVKAGEVQADQAREVVGELVERTRRNSERLVETVRQEVRSQITALGLASQDDLDRLEARVASLLGKAAGRVEAAAEKVAGKAASAPAAPQRPAPSTPGGEAKATKTSTAKKAATKKAAAKKATTKKAAAKKATTKKATTKKATAKKAAAKSAAARKSTKKA